MFSRIQIVLASSIFFFGLAQVPMYMTATTSSTSNPEEASCHMREIDLCLASVAVLSQGQNNHPINNAEIDRQCKLLNETEGCLQNFTRRCMTDNQHKLVDMLADGGLDTIKDLCKPQSKLRGQYLAHGNCINSQQKVHKVCMRDFQASLEKAVDITWQDRLKLACCSFNRLHACVKDVIEPKCGAEAYELNRLFFRASFSRLPQISCAQYDYNSKSCASLFPPAGTVPKGAKSHSVLSKLMSSYTGN